MIFYRFKLIIEKSEWLYWHAFHWILVVTNFKNNPYKIVLDFEKAMINACNY